MPSVPRPQSDPDRPARSRRALVHRRAGSWAPTLDERAGGAASRLRQSTARARGARQAAPAVPRRVRRTILRSRVRHRRHAPHPLARASEHPQTTVDPRERLQSRHSHAAGVWPRHAARAPRSALGRARTRNRPRDALRTALDDDARASGALAAARARVVPSFGARNRFESWRGFHHGLLCPPA